MASLEQLQNLPAVDEILRHDHLAATTQRFPRQQLVEWVRAAVSTCRQEILNGRPYDAAGATQFVVTHILQQDQAEQGRRQQAVINATGILLHTNLGRAPLAAAAVRRMQESAGYANVEMNLQSGKRSQRGARTCRLLSQLTGAEDTVVVNNCAAATMLVLQSIAAGREVIVSRGQLVEIGGGYRLPEVFAASGAILKEVGTTNRTYLRDYENAVTENTAAIIRVHRSNFFLGGFVTEPDLSDLVALGRERGVTVIDDLGSGCMQDLTDLGLHEPTVPASVSAGADLVLFSGDKLFGGPQAGIIVGRSIHTEGLRASPMMRALRVDKVTLAALEATAEIHLSGDGSKELPLLQMLSKDPADICSSCERVRHQLSLPDGVSVEVTECHSQVGGGSVPGSEIPSFCLQISGLNSETLAARLRSGTPAVLGRIQDDRVILDMRTVRDAERDELAAKISSVISQLTTQDA